MREHHTSNPCETCEQYKTETEEFLTLLKGSYSSIGATLPTNVLDLHYRDLIYTARLQAVVQYGRANGFQLDKAAFDNLVNGRMRTNAVREYLCDFKHRHGALIQITESLL